MKFAVSALFALALLAGNTGCRFFCGCRACDPCMDDCGGGCGLGGCGLGRLRQCGCQVGPFGGGGCDGGIGCSRRLHIFNWSRCLDRCDDCAHWTGEGLVPQSGGFHPRPGAGLESNYNEEAGGYDEREPYDEPKAAEPGAEGEPEPQESGSIEPTAHVVPGSMRVTTRRLDSEWDDEGFDEMQITERPRAIPAAPRRARRISSNRMN